MVDSRVSRSGGGYDLKGSSSETLGPIILLGRSDGFPFAIARNLETCRGTFGGKYFAILLVG